MKIYVEYNLLKSLLTLATIIEARDAYTGGHTWRVSQYAHLLAQDIGMNKEESFAVQIGALVHDLGKVGVPDHILNKPGPLDDAEYSQMKEHPSIGLKAIHDHPLFDLVSTAIGQHHERLDGNGYPFKYKNETLSMIARIISLSDAFDAMTSTRSYRKGMHEEKALAIIEENKGVQFDPDLSLRLENLNGKGKLQGILLHAYNDVPLLSCPVCGPTMVPQSKAESGDHIICPACTGDFTLHRNNKTFELQFSGNQQGFYVPKPDEYSIGSVLQEYTKEVHL